MKNRLEVSHIKTEPGVFIIESTYLEDEKVKRHEGSILKELLNLLGVKAEYKYIRTRLELEAMLDKFHESNLRYLHISCHGNEVGLGLTLEEVDFSEIEDFEVIREQKLAKRRLFISACSVASKELGKAFVDSKVKSIIAPTEDIGFEDAAMFWASFYYFMYKDNSEGMNNKAIIRELEKLSVLYEMKMKAYLFRKKKSGFKTYKFPEKVSKKKERVLV